MCLYVCIYVYLINFKYISKLLMILIDRIVLYYKEEED